jgi:hypothetical protein
MCTALTSEPLDGPFLSRCYGQTSLTCAPFLRSRKRTERELPAQSTGLTHQKQHSMSNTLCQGRLRLRLALGRRSAATTDGFPILAPWLLPARQLDALVGGEHKFAGNGHPALCCPHPEG